MREHQEHEHEGKIAVQELPKRGSIKRAKDAIEKGPEDGEMDHSQPADLYVVSQTGVAKASRDKFEKGEVSSPEHAPKILDDLPEAGVTSSKKGLFESGNLERRAEKRVDDLDEIQGGIACSARYWIMSCSVWVILVPEPTLSRLMKLPNNSLLQKRQRDWVCPAKQSHKAVL